MAIHVPISKLPEKYDSIKKDTKNDMRKIFGTFKVEDYHTIVPTYKTVFIPIKKKHSNAILHQYEQVHKPFHTNVVTDNDKKALLDLEEEISKKFPKSSKDEDFDKDKLIKPPVFVRLSTRSPKDAIVNLKEFPDILLKQIEKEPLNETLAMLQTQHILNQCHNAKDVVKMLVNSKRVYDDLMMSNLFNDENNKIDKDEEVIKSQQLLLREFDSSLKPELEFRCFVKYVDDKKELKITGITQYYKNCYVEFLAKNEKKIENFIVKKLHEIFNEKIKGKINQSFTIDIGLQYDDFENLAIIELNPFGMRTGGCLFDWNKKEDKEILEGESGKDVMSFRILKELKSVQFQRKNFNEKIKKTLDEIKPIKYEEEKKKSENVDEKKKKINEKKKKGCLIM